MLDPGLYSICAARDLAAAAAKHAAGQCASGVLPPAGELKLASR